MTDGFHNVLGERVLLDGAADPYSRVVVADDGMVLGVGCFRLLYGPYAEVALALRDPSARSVAQMLIGLLSQRLLELGTHTLQAVVEPGQEQLAHSLCGAVVLDGLLKLPLTAGSVASRGDDAQDAPMTPAPTASKMLS